MGRTFFEQASRSLAELKGAEINAQSTSQEPMGLLRVTAVADFATQVLAPHFFRLYQALPESDSGTCIDRPECSIWLMTTLILQFELGN